MSRPAKRLETTLSKAGAPRLTLGINPGEFEQSAGRHRTGASGRCEGGRASSAQGEASHDVAI